jgi:hypothetical protein
MKIKQIIKEFGDPQGQYTPTATPVAAPPEPNKGFVVRLTGIAGSPDRGAKLTWAALSSVLPKDFPPGDGEDGYSLRAQELVNRLAKTKQPQVVKGGLTRDMAETIASKITNWPTTTKIPTDVVEQ